jgi:phage terminase large subunit GpA-like protein
VQKDRIEYTIMEWGAGEEAWAIEHVILPGQTANPEVWEDLADAWDDLDIDAAGIDSGYNTSQVKKFCSTRKWCFATKGVAGQGRAIVEDVSVRVKRLRKRRDHSVPIEPIGVDNAKAMIYARLKLTTTGGPGFIHFPNTQAFDDEYFEQVTAERLVTKIRGTRPYHEWVQIRPRNEALDCLVGNLAVLRLGVNLAKLDQETPKARTQNATQNATPQPDPIAAPPAPKPPQQPARVLGRRVSRPAYLK